MAQYDPDLHAQRLASNQPPGGMDQDYPAPQHPLYYTPGRYAYPPGQYPYPPVQPLRKPWSRRHPFLFWLGVVATGLVVSTVIVNATGSNSLAPVSAAGTAPATQQAMRAATAPAAVAAPRICTRIVLPDLASIHSDMAHGGGSNGANYMNAATTAMNADNAVTSDSSFDIGSSLDTDLTQLATDLAASTPDGPAIRHDIANVEDDCK